MTDRPADAVIFVLLDAFRHDYLVRTRYLRQIAACSLTGVLEEPFGFCPRGAYFGGLTMAEQGHTNMFRFDPDASVFRWTRELAGGDGDGAVSARLRGDILWGARAHATAFTAAYLDPLQIPLPWLSYFDASERHAPSSRDVGYRSLFHILEDSGRSWMDVSWPYPGWTGALTNGRVAAFALDELSAAHAFAYIHLPDLDIKGHAYGPGAREVQSSIEETDRLCEIIASRACELFRDPLIVFAGDHGMLPVVRQVDVASALAQTGLRFGHDAVYFIDSTMVRCWFFTERARSVVTATLRNTAGGRLLSADDEAHWGLAGIDARNGHAIFLADPGVVFSPSFFNWADGCVPRGMHGYAPDVEDNRALFLAHWPRRQRPGRAGVVAARQLFPSFLEWLGYDAASFTRVAPVRDIEPPVGARWSIGGTPASDAVVDAHLARLTDAVRKRAPEAEAIVLAGGFGRGEGTVVTDGAAPRPVNDYDVVVVGSDGASLAGLGTSLAREFGLDFVELWPRPTLTPTGNLSQFDFDLRYASRLLWGNPLLVDRLARYAPEELALDEGVFQLGNRAGGLLVALTDGYAAADSPRDFLARQTAKFLIAVADCWLMAHADYHPSYAIRRDRFRTLAGSIFSADTLAAVDAGFRAKLEGDGGLPLDREAAGLLASAALDDLERALGWRVDPGAVVRALASTVPPRIRGGTEWIASARAHGLMTGAAGESDRSGSLLAIYRGCLEALRSWGEDPTTRSLRLRGTLAPWFEPAAEYSEDQALAGVARTWLQLFH